MIVVRRERLLDEVGVFLDTGISSVGTERSEVFTGRKMAKGRNAHIDHEPTAEIKVGGGVSETGDLRVLGREVVDRVEHKGDE